MKQQQPEVSFEAVTRESATDSRKFIRDKSCLIIF